MVAEASILQEVQRIKSYISRLTNKDLKELCRMCGLTMSGNKSDLLQRLTAHVTAFANRRDNRSVDEISNRISVLGRQPYHRTPRPRGPYGPELTTGPSAMQGHRGLPQSGVNRHPHPTPKFEVSFKESIFFIDLEPLADSISLAVPPGDRVLGELKVKLTEDHVNKLADSAIRIMLYSAEEPKKEDNKSAEVAFPPHVEVRGQNETIRKISNGTKNKSGPSRPVDITDNIPKHAYRDHVVKITCASPSSWHPKDFRMCVFLVRMPSVDNILKSITRIFSKDKVASEIRERARHEEIVIESAIISLRDPIAGIRITKPCRSTACLHTECFDAKSFLQLQQQAPTWQCPICSESISFETLAIDKYVQDIIEKTKPSTDQVRIYPDATWFEGTADQTNRGAVAAGIQPCKRGALSDESDDDLVEIVAPRSMPQSHGVFTPRDSRELSAAFAVSGSSGNKRKADIVIDLTGSDDEDPNGDEAARSAKRNIGAYNTPNSLPDSCCPAHLSSNVHSAHSPAEMAASHHLSFQNPDYTLSPPDAPMNFTPWLNSRYY